MAPPSTSQPDNLFLQGPFAVSAHTADPTGLALPRAKKKTTSLIGNLKHGHSDPIPFTKQMLSTLLPPAKFSTL